MYRQKPSYKINISDVAQAAGCSIASVSRVLNNTGYPVSPDLKQKILEASSRLGYIPNPYGKILRTSINSTIGIIIPSFQNPFFSQIIMGIEQIASLNGFSCMVLTSKRDPLLERKYINDLIRHRVACLMLCSVDSESDVVEQFIATGGRVCLFESNFPIMSNVLNANADMYEASKIATQHLIDNGHKKIAYLTPPLVKSSRHDRLDGFLDAMQENGLLIDKEDIISLKHENDDGDGLYEYNMGKELAKKLLLKDKKYTAAIASNDLIACGVIAGLNKQGVKVPYDISVIGFDDIPNAIMIIPQLTTVNLFGYQIAQKATQKIINAFENNASVEGERILFAPELVIRNSVRNII